VSETAAEPAGDGRWHTIEPASKIRPGEVLGFELGSRRIAVGRRADGGYFAVGDTCPHAGASLAEGMLDGDLLICPIHAFAYCTRTGEGHDDGDEIRVYPVRVREDDVLEVHVPA